MSDLAPAAKQEPTQPRQRSSRNSPSLAETFADSGDLALASALLRSTTIRERYYLLMRIIYVLAGCLALAIFGCVVLALRPSNPTYFASSDDGRIVPIVPLSQPIMTTNALANWVANAVTTSLSISFSTVDTDLQNAQQFFTPGGFVAFTNALEASQVLPAIRGNRENEYVITTGAPVLMTKPGVLDADGHQYWIWRVPINVTLESADVNDSKEHVVFVTVVRVPQAQNPSGLGISAFAEQ